jgi:hypothetical protein
MAFSVHRRSVIALGASLLGACGLLHVAHPPSDACWTIGPPTSYIIRDAANALIAMKGPNWDRMRVLAAVPLVVDSIRAHSRVLTDQATCARLWSALDPHERGPHIAVVQIGQTYWARSADGMNAFDNTYRWVAGFVDQ